jgi:site-specific DNA-cytosine methylase
MMRYGSVCSGIEAASVAWKPLGWKAAWFSEIEAFPSAVLDHHWPEVANLGDMTALPERVESGEIEAPDVLVGGTPCQAFSVAGNRESLSDARGNLTLTYVELANAIDRKRAERGEQPVIVVWENVPGVLNTKDNAFGCFLAGLAGEDVPLLAPGGKWTNAGLVVGPQRAVAWRILDAQYFGVAQRRRRVFVVASARDGFDPSQILFEFDGLRRDSAPRRETWQDASADVGCRTPRAGSHWDDLTNPHPSLNQSFNTGGIGASNQEVFSQRGSGLTWPADVASTLNAAFGSKLGLEDQHINSGAPLFVPSAVSVTGDITHALNTANNGKGSSEDGTGRGVPTIAQTVALRGRDGGATAELGGEVATALRASSGGGDKPHVLAEVSETLHTQGIRHGDDYARPQKTHAATLLQTLRDAVGEETFAQWVVGILDSLQPAPVLQPNLHGGGLRYSALSRNWPVYCALSREENRAEGAMQSVRDAERARCSPPGRELSEQLARELGAYLSLLSQPGASAASAMHDMWSAAEGLGVLRETLSAFQEVGRPARGEGKPARTAFAVRRLMVMECEFLQGFPRNFTLVPIRNKPAADGPRYKALGNSMAVPVMAWIGRRIAAYIT